DCRTMPLSCVLLTPQGAGEACVSKGDIVASILRDAATRLLRMRVFQTVLRPRAHRAVGRWPPASGTGRRIEKKISSRSGGVKPSRRVEVNDKRHKVSW